MNGSGNGGENLIFQTQPSSGTNPNPNQPTTKMTIHADGNIGIGTTPHATYKAQIAGDVLLTSGWLRTTGSTGWYNQTYGGGWNMTDATWIRSYGNKSIYQNTGTLRTDGTLQVGSNGTTLNVPNNGNLSYRTDVLFANTAGNVGIGTVSPDRPLSVVKNTEWNIASRNTLTTATFRNHILLQRANGTAAVTAGFTLGGVAMGGFDGTNYSYGWNGGAEISAFANQTYTETARGTYLTLSTTADNTASIQERVRINASGTVQVNNLAGTGTRSVYVTSNGTLTTGSGGSSGTKVEKLTKVQMSNNTTVYEVFEDNYIKLGVYRNGGVYNYTILAKTGYNGYWDFSREDGGADLNVASANTWYAYTGVDWGVNYSGGIHYMINKEADLSLPTYRIRAHLHDTYNSGRRVSVVVEAWYP